MSANRLVLWDEFIKKLEGQAGILYDESLNLSPDIRAQRACTKIRNSRGPGCLLDAIREALNPKEWTEETPPQTAKLAAINWPLAVSTNYDDLYYGASRNLCKGASQGEMRVRVLGRSPKDCKLVLSSLHGPFDRRYIWHVQGFLGGQFGGGIEKEVDDDLRNQLVVGHAEYRVVANASPHFRRCFGEMFRSRSFLFLGSNLKEDYFLNLFGEVLDLCGPSDIPHFAFTDGKVDAHFLADQMNITVCEFSKENSYKDLPDWLERLRNAIVKPEAWSTRWSFAVGYDSGAQCDLDVIRDEAPLQPGPEEVIALVASRKGENEPPCLPDRYAELNQKYPLNFIGEHLVKYGDAEIYAVTARCRGDEDDSAVDVAVHELLNEVVRHSEAKAVHLQMSSAGGTVPPVFAFMRVVRAFGKWKRAGRDRDIERSPLRLILHIPWDVEFNLTSGRIDVQELLSSELIRFWAVVSSDINKEPVRRVLYYKEDAELKDVLDDLGVPFGKDMAKWTVSVCPSPRKPPKEDLTGKTPEKADKDTWSLPELVKTPTLFSIGVVFGSVLTLECEDLATCPVKAAAH